MACHGYLAKMGFKKGMKATSNMMSKIRMGPCAGMFHSQLGLPGVGKIVIINRLYGLLTAVLVCAGTAPI